VKVKCLSQAVFLSLGLIAVDSAQAVNYVEIDGADVQFFYDADFWGNGVAKVTGNTITFDLGEEYNTSAKVKAGNNTSYTSYADQTVRQGADIGLVAVAKSGYTMKSYLDLSLTGSYSVAEQGGIATGSAYGAIYWGDFYGGEFANTFYLFHYSADNQVSSSGAPSSGTFAQGSTSELAMGGGASAVGVDTFLQSAVQQFGFGRTASGIASVTYGFDVSAAPVPEPATYAMLLAGLGLMGAMSTRRKASRKH
jgi:hypothetical protein